MSVVLFELSHPKHYLQFKGSMQALVDRAEVRVVARDKDVLLALLDADGVRYEVYNRRRHGLWAKALGAPSVLREYRSILRRIRPDLIVSKSSPYAAVLGRMRAATTVVMLDSEGVLLNERLVIPLSDWVVTPASMDRDYGSKHRRVSGVFEAAYLHPDRFRPDPSVKQELGLSDSERFAVLRFVSWGANHDLGESGIAEHERHEVIASLQEHLRVFVSVEGPLHDALEPYRLLTPPSRIHDVLAAASLYLGDSQTMATEAALLGTPAVRCNSFVGATDFSNFRVLEDEYGLLHNYRDFSEAKAKSVELARDRGSKDRYSEGRARYFRDVGDVNAEIVGFLEELL